ncbi:single-stranded-DNA-specific exonuclease RecJ [Hazenella sp. IB182357]|uniref:Single-stranded-DNA-specific exonuclease RecJ n=1 Tax=Polycladospora coralii TaxID=2771432 RepID=A0A926N677_9BACL|nr:single-stranded-DNA-specific exonuclease RecJ [Polycladospora coralii]MBD1371711.1 single-stranded-DNA-specific exonuclease RecJ [Polycladospora coralii]MBS7529178.1 single-stranded-DNA-specific exonuclease RecJ [Polycladospora coralii]
MLHGKSRWTEPAIEEACLNQLVSELEIHPTVAKMLIRRGIRTTEKADRFLRPQLEDLHDPFLLDGMEIAVERVQQALIEDENILIYGDYDVDGVSSTSLMIKLFQLLGKDVDFYIPNRFTEGYGLHKEALKQAKEKGYHLIITVDTGISAVEEARYAKEIGLDLIITDHHEPPAILPDAYTIINPKKQSCKYPYDMLAGVGVAFKFATALLEYPPIEFLDLVALGTISDLVPLLDENRIFATWGLKQMNMKANLGLNALVEVAGIEQDINATHVGFSIGPRINASGRLDQATEAVTLLTTENIEEARSIANHLDQLNRHRQDLVNQTTEAAIEQIESDPEKHEKVIVVADESWHVGVIGIVASRLVEKYYRPVLVLGIDEKTGIAKGSARSIAGFNLYQALTACSERFVSYGGHEMAAGMSIPRNELEPLQIELSTLASKWLLPEDWISKIVADDSLNIDQIDLALIDLFQSLSPFGMGNPTPVFQLHLSKVARIQLLGKDKSHIKLYLEKEGNHLEAIGFRMSELANEMAPQVHVNVMGELQVNEWNGRRNPQMIIRDLKVPHLQIFDWRGNANRHIDFEHQVAYIYSEPSTIPDEIRTKKQIMLIDWYSEQIETVMPRHVVLLDSPPTMNHFERLMAACEHVERLFFAYGDASFDDVLVRIPKREEFGRLFQILKSGTGPIIFPKHLPALVRATGLKPKVITFMLQVFEELGFIIIKQGRLEWLTASTKKDLSESQIFKQQLDRQEVRERLVYSSYRELCNYLYTNYTFKWHLGGNETDELQG